jgi:hypothetical protein
MKRAALILALAGAAALPACGRRTVVVDRQPSPVVVTQPAQKEVIVAQPAAPAREVIVVQPSQPPAARVEVRTASPGPDYVWVPGSYEFRDGQWEWTAGRWVVPERPAAIWEPGHWEKVPGGYIWQPGHWR